MKSLMMLVVTLDDVKLAPLLVYEPAPWETDCVPTVTGGPNPG